MLVPIRRPKRIRYDRNLYAKSYHLRLIGRLCRSWSSKRVWRYPILIRAREQLVKTRTLLVNAVRGLVKSVGGRLPASSSEYFHIKAKDLIPEELQGALVPLGYKVQATAQQRLHI